MKIMLNSLDCPENSTVDIQIPTFILEIAGWGRGCSESWKGIGEVGAGGGGERWWLQGDLRKTTGISSASGVGPERGLGDEGWFRTRNSFDRIMSALNNNQSFQIIQWVSSSAIRTLTLPLISRAFLPTFQTLPPHTSCMFLENFVSYYFKKRWTYPWKQKKTSL